MKNILLITLLIMCGLCALAQDPLVNQFTLYPKTKSQGKLFVHYDKNVYSVNEMVWFTGYLINSNNIKGHKLMSVSLVRESDNQVVLEDRFEMKNGLAFGSIALPDSVSLGNYRLLAITDYTVNGEPEATFTQYITIKSELEPPFKTKMNVLDVQGNKQRIVVYSTTANNLFFNKPADVTYIYGNIRNTIKSDNKGRAVIDLDYQKDLNDPTLYVKVVYGKDSTFVNMPIEEAKGTPIVKFFPEGGNVVSNLANRIGWEAKDGNKQPIKLTAYLYKNNERIDTVKSNDYGMGAFNLFAEENAKYTLHIVGNKGLKDTVFSLPESNARGIVLNVPTAVSSTDVLVTLRAKEMQTVNLRVHNFKTIFVHTKVDMKPGQRTIKIPLTQIPKGLLTITVTDDQERPLAERLIFAHYDSRANLEIVPSKKEYGTREKVILKINPQGLNNTSVVSVAVVQDNRFEQGKMTDIESFTYLNSEMASVPSVLKGDLVEKKKHLEDILLIKGWRKYQWDELTKVTAKDTSLIYGNLRYLGAITKSKKKLSSPLELGAMLGQNIVTVNTAKNGTFDFNSPDLYVEMGKKLSLFVNKNKDDRSFKLNIDNQLLTSSAKLAGRPSRDHKPPLLAQADNSDLFFKIGEKSIRLDEVLVSREVARGAMGPNACGDYVCFYNVLNCTAHYTDKRNTSPISGRKYKYYGGGKGMQTVLYPGCTAGAQDRSLFMDAEGVHMHKVFYADTFEDPLEPAFYSTIYWNHAVILGRDKQATVEFHTGDIAGKYRVVIQGVQGVGQNEVVSGQQFFEVKAK